MITSHVLGHVTCHVTGHVTCHVICMTVKSGDDHIWKIAQNTRQNAEYPTIDLFQELKVDSMAVIICHFATQYRFTDHKVTQQKSHHIQIHVITLTSYTWFFIRTLSKS